MPLSENTPAATSHSEQPAWATAGMMTAEALRREPIQLHLDIPYADSEHPRQQLDLYLPQETASSPPPLLVFIHGGGWQGGDKAMGAGRLLPFVRQGQYVGAAIGYRVSGDATWPAQLHDCKAAIRWLRAHTAHYEFDPDRIVVWGTSAGGQCRA